MSVVSIVIPTYRGIHAEAQAPLMAMSQNANCLCRGKHGERLHDPWKCPNGKHFVRFIPPTYLSSVVHWARNQAVALAMYGQPDDGIPPSDYFFLMDDDMLGQPDYLNRLLAYKLDIVCGICTIKRDPPRPNIRFWRPDECRFADPLLWDFESTKLMEIDAAGAAFMLVRRRVFEAMEKAYLDCEFERIEDERKLGASEKISEYWKRKSEHRYETRRIAIEKQQWGLRDFWPFQFLDNIADRQVGELGEDIGFCWKAKQLGFKIFADPQILPGHIGTYGYSILDYREYIEEAIRQGAVDVNSLPPNRVALEQEAVAV